MLNYFLTRSCFSSIKCIKLFMVAVLAVLLSSSFVFAEDSAGAQIEAGKFGLLAYTNSLFMLYSDSGLSMTELRSPWIGCIYHATENFAIKPAFMLFKSNGEGKDVDDNTKTEETHLSYGLEISLYYYQNMGNNFSMYMGPQFLYLKSSIENKDTNYGSFTDKITSTSAVLGLCFGVQYMLNERFGFFADFGIAYAKIKDTEKMENEDGNTLDETENSDTSIVTKGGNIGAVFYFN